MATRLASSVAPNMIGRHIASHPELFEPARNNCFDLVISGIDQLLRAGVSADNATEDDIIYNASDVIRLSIENFPVGNLHYTLKTTDVRKVNSTVKFAAEPTWNSGNFKCTDWVGVRTKAVLEALQAQAYDINNDVIKEASNYKHIWTVYEYNCDYTQRIRTWTLYGAWISEVSEEDFTHDNGEKRSITVKVEFDRAVPTEG